MKDWQNTCSLIPDGVSTLSKMPSKYVEGIYPKYIDSGNGSKIYADGREYIDYPLGLGSILIGHNVGNLNVAFAQQQMKGLCFPIPSPMETKLAMKLSALIPSCEMVRFLTTGSEACQAAARVARAYTGKNVILYSGYHGWHDWYNVSTPKNKGVPEGFGKYVRKFEHGNLEQLTDMLKRGKDVAAVMVEPYIYDETKKEYLIKLRNLCNKHSVLLIFDEVVTGFRTLGGSAQKHFGVTPDISAFGKALGNGVPISFVCGKKDIMQVLCGDCFVSSTFGGWLGGVASALAVLDFCDAHGVAEHIWAMGKILKDGFNDIARDMALEVKCTGYPCRTFFSFPTPEHKSLFWQHCIGMGVFFGHAQFISYSHDYNDISKTLEVCRQGLAFVKNHWEKPELALRGSVASETLRMVNLRKEDA